jgi:hypothetical protein
MYTRTLRNALIALTALSFSITATSCGRQALSPIPPQKEQIVIHLPWKNKVVDFVFGFSGQCIAMLFLCRWAYYKLTEWDKRDVADQTPVALRHRRARQL